MRKCCLLLVYVALLGAGPRHDDLSELGFLAGTWKGEAFGGEFEEHWMAPSGGSMIGASRFVRNGKLAGYEFMTIRNLGGGVALYALPSSNLDKGEKPVRFAMAAHSATFVQFENRQHDFPQVIRYELKDGTMTVLLEGKENGKDEKVTFSMKKAG